MARIPIATYRVQLTKDFPFEKARQLLPFLQKMGISDLYASPVFVARPGSMHGYDVVDPSRANPELGGNEGFDALAEDLKSRGMGLLLDIVPNHMAASSSNQWWSDVLESGPSSRYAAFFDVEWDPGWERGEEKIFLPVLGSPFGTVLENQEIQLHMGDAGFTIRYYAATLPVDPSTYAQILDARRDEWPQSEEFQALMDSIGRLPDRQSMMWEAIEARRREVPSIKSTLSSLYRSHPEVTALVDRLVVDFNGTKGNPASFDRLEDLIESQAYRLSWWQVARERMNYRRFFDVSELIGIRVENPEVFAATHSAILEWVEQGKATGLRVDHVDGLWNPREYLERLNALGNRPYLLVEKILLEDERLPSDWPIEGTSGYDFLGIVNAVFIDPSSLDALQDTYTRFTGLSWNFEDAAYEQKRWIIRHLFRGEMFALSLHLALIAEEDRHGRDLSPDDLRQALTEVTACLRVYRTYFEDGSMPPRDRDYIRGAVAEARRRNPGVSEAAYNFLQRVLLLGFPRRLSESGKRTWIRFIRRWQQLTSPITAKGVEDTTMYVYNRLLSMNEVGAQHHGISLEQFHQFNEHRQRHWPAAMSTTSTHDTKRSADVRARLNVLSEMPGEWNRYLFRWARWNRDKKLSIDGRPIPDPNEETFLYQTLLGAWPFDEQDIPSFIDRVKQYIVKASREAKVYSSWMRPNEEHERAIHQFLEAILERGDGNRFLPHFLEVQQRIAFFGAMNSLSQELLKIAAPGVPDFYQNTMLWDLSLVDPDNRRLVEMDTRLRIAEEIDDWHGGIVRELLENWRDGRVKAFLIHRALNARRADPDLFIRGSYVPLEVDGTHRDCVVAFARQLDSRMAVAVVPRFMTRVASIGRAPIGRRAWKATVVRMPEGHWTDAITGRTVTGSGVGEILSTFPVALLLR